MSILLPRSGGDEVDIVCIDRISISLAGSRGHRDSREVTHRERICSFSSVHSSPMPIQSDILQSISHNTHSIPYPNDASRLSTLAAAHAARTTIITTAENIPFKQIHLARDREDLSNELTGAEKDRRFPRQLISDLCSLFRINTFRLLIISMVFIWSLDETNFLFLADLLRTSNLPEQRSTLLIAITGIADLIGQLFFG